MIAWSVALAAALMLVAWGGANWRAFHLAYCRHLLGSGDQERVAEALRLMAKYGHVRAGMSYQEVCRIMQPLEPQELRVRTVGRFTGDGQVFPSRTLGPVRNPDRVIQINALFNPPLQPGQVGYVDVYGPPISSSLARAGAWSLLYVEFRNDTVFSIEVKEPV